MSANKNERMKEKDIDRKIGLMLELVCERERDRIIYSDRESI